MWTSAEKKIATLTLDVRIVSMDIGLPLKECAKVYDPLIYSALFIIIQYSHTSIIQYTHFIQRLGVGPH